MFSTIRLRGFAIACVGLGVLALAGVRAGEVPSIYTHDGQLVKPAAYREWVNIGTGLGMAYGPAREKAGAHPPFTNVFVSPASYRGFLERGVWPEQTVFVLEIRRSVPVNAEGAGNGHYQGDLVAIEAEVKDSARFEKGWGFFNLPQDRESGAQIPTTASCYACHATNAAVENTFVQFYPVLRDVAKQHRTFKDVATTF